MRRLRSRKGHTYRIVVSDLDRGRPIWFGGADRSAASMGQFYAGLSGRKRARLRLAVMVEAVPPGDRQAGAGTPAILFDKFPVMRHHGAALDAVHQSQYGRLAGRDRRSIKGQKYTLLARHENRTRDGKKALKVRLSANQRRNTADVL